jgi:23S rRNA (guanosine2251-2'-O)-methyltransferase
MIYGRNTVLEWLQADQPIDTLIIVENAKGNAIEKITRLAKQNNVPVVFRPKKWFQQKCGHVNHQGVAGQHPDFENYKDLADLFEIARARQEPPFFAILDEIQDPHNMGAILRSADGAGVHGIIIPKDKAVGITPVVYKSSSGAAAHIAVARVTNLVRAIKQLKDSRVWIIGTDGQAEKSYAEMDYRLPVAIVMGSEGKGLRRLVKENCDFLSCIPLLGKINSLNVSVAAALYFFQARLQRSSK